MLQFVVENFINMDWKKHSKTHYLKQQMISNLDVFTLCSGKFIITDLILLGSRYFQELSKVVFQKFYLSILEYLDPFKSSHSKTITHIIIPKYPGNHEMLIFLVVLQSDLFSSVCHGYFHGYFAIFSWKF